MLHVVGKLLLFTIFFNYLYAVHYRFSPVSTNIVISIIGLIVYIAYPDVRKEMFKNKSVWGIVLLFLPIIAISLFTIVLNGTQDFYFIKWSFLGMLSLFGAMLLSFFIKKLWGGISSQLIVSLMVLSAICQLTIALAIWISPSIHDLLFSITHFDIIGVDALERTEGHRLLGFGISFFPSGVIHGLILLLMSIYIGKKTGIWLFLWILSFIFITAIGMMMARTAIVGALMALAMLLYNVLRNNIRINTLFSIFSFTIFVIVFISYFTTYLSEDFDTIIKFGFQMFISKQETGEMHVDSWDSMVSMYRFPSEFTTWIIGDGKWMNDNQNGYYMNTDIGFIRMIYYFGIIGLLSYLLLHLHLLKIICDNDRAWGRSLLLFVLIFVCIINCKGFVDIIQYLFLFYFCEETPKKLIVEKK